jgi:hypothetical protein
MQSAERIENPYFGESMYRCGEITAVLPAAEAATH